MPNSSLLSRTLQACIPVLTLGIVSLASAVAADAPLVAGKPILVPESKGGFDYLEFDDANRRLLADHPGNGTLDVIDGDSGKLIKHVPTGASQSVAIDAEAGRYYAGVSREKIVAVVDMKTLEKVGEYPIGGPADAMVLDPKNHNLYVDHDDGKDVWVLDSKTGKLVGTVAIEEAPEYVVYDPASEQIFQNIKSNGTVAVIDPTTNKVKATWKTDPAANPHGLALDGKTRRLFSAGGNGTLVVMDADSGKVLSTVPIAKGVDQIAFDPSNQRIYCAAGGAGAVTVLQETEKGVESLGDVKTATGAHTVTVDPKTHAVWVAYTERESGKSYVLRLEAK